MTIYGHQSKAPQDGVHTCPCLHSFLVCRAVDAVVVPDADEQILRLFFMNGDIVPIKYGPRKVPAPVWRLERTIGRLMGYSPSQYALMVDGERMLSERSIESYIDANPYANGDVYVILNQVGC